MDVNGDGRIDVLSGSYCRTGEEEPSAGTFQVLLGTEHGFQRAKELKGSDGKSLIIAIRTGEDQFERMCTRPFAVDLNGDGKLDIVSGNLRGTFVWFRGTGKGKFAPQSVPLHGLYVDGHSDPFLTDWDGDGDFDLFSGASGGGVCMYPNDGTKKEAAFGERRVLLEPPKPGEKALTLGDAHLTGPGSDTRVWIDDVDGDGKRDLLVGDAVWVFHAAKGVAETTIRAKLPEVEERLKKHFDNRPDGDGTTGREEKWRRELEALEKEREKLVRYEHTGFVWLFRAK